jgi:hypothetical protein
MSADKLDPDFSLTVGGCFSALLLAPFAIVLGGPAVSIQELRMPLSLGGMVFWPAYGIFSWLWWRYPRWIMLLLIAVWTFQGFFQIGHRASMLTV